MPTKTIIRMSAAHYDVTMTDEAGKVAHVDLAQMFIGKTHQSIADAKSDLALVLCATHGIVAKAPPAPEKLRVTFVRAAKPRQKKPGLETPMLATM